MSLRIFSSGICLLVAACGGPPQEVAPADAANVLASGSGTPPGEPIERIACAVGNAAFEQVCTVDRTFDRDGTLLTIRHPDGSFRRLRVGSDGSMRAADGAMPAQVTQRDGVADVTIDDARYQFPTRTP